MHYLKFKNGLYLENFTFLDGGGSNQYLDFLEVLEIMGNKHYNTAFEWCAGLGAIGFSILDAGICDNLVFSDTYKPAVEFLEKTAIANNRTVQAFCCDAISKLPQHEKFDLVVANPPHCMVSHHDVLQMQAKEKGHVLSEEDLFHNDRLILDTGWEIHKEFFTNIKEHLNEGCDILLSETDTHSIHKEMAQEGGLTFIKSYPANMLKTVSHSNSSIIHYKYLP